MFEQIKVIGFDLDHTLYPKSEDINRVVQGYIAGRIAQIKEISFGEAMRQWNETYEKLQSGSQTLKTLGIPPDPDLVQEALENANVVQYLNPDPRIPAFLERLGKKYCVDLITSSNRDIVGRKLAKLEMPASLFKHLITRDEAKKSDGEAFLLWLSQYPDLQPENFVYIGDRAKVDVLVPRSLDMQAVLVNTNSVDPDMDVLQLPTVLDIEQYFLN